MKRKTILIFILLIGLILCSIKFYKLNQYEEDQIIFLFDYPKDEINMDSIRVWILYEENSEFDNLYIYGNYQKLTQSSKPSISLVTGMDTEISTISDNKIQGIFKSSSSVKVESLDNGGKKYHLPISNSEGKILFCVKGSFINKENYETATNFSLKFPEPEKIYEIEFGDIHNFTETKVLPTPDFEDLYSVKYSTAEKIKFINEREFYFYGENKPKRRSVQNTIFILGTLIGLFIGGIIELVISMFKEEK